MLKKVHILLLSKEFLLCTVLLFLSCIWLRPGLDSIYVDTDLGRDLSELSKLWTGTKVIWLGPRLSPGLQASPLYYYLFYPALVIGNGDPHSLLIFNYILGLIALGLLGFLAIRKYGNLGVMIPLLIGVLPWWQNIILHPGNGYTYTFFIVACLTFLWFELSLIVAAFLFGIAFSMHPAAIFTGLIVLYEWWRRKHSFIQFILMGVVIVIPSSPILLFEFITKGYLVRQWMSHPDAGMHLAFNTRNILNFLDFSKTPTLFSFFLVALNGIISRNRMRVWFILSLIGLLFFAVVSTVPMHYLYGVLCMFWFIIAITLVEKSWGKFVCVFLIVLFICITLFTKTSTIQTRSLSELNIITNEILKTKTITTDNKVAVVAALYKDTKVPMADDYRFFLRMKGYNVMDVQAYNQADRLVMIIEAANFDWKKWSSWEIEQFGSKKVVDEIKVSNVKIIIFSK